MFGLWKRGKKGRGAAITVALIGEGYRRTYVRHILGDRVEVGAELVGDKRAHMLAEIDPEVVVLDCASEGINPLLALPKLAGLAASPRVVALTDNSVAGGLDEDALHALGADATSDIRDPAAVIWAVLPVDTEPAGAEPARRGPVPAGAVA